MIEDVFDRPVFVRSGKFTIPEIASIGDAVDFLDEWPQQLRDRNYEEVKRACLSALDGTPSLNAARNDFAKWAKAADILEELSSVPAWMTGAKPGPGGMLT